MKVTGRTWDQHILSLLLGVVLGIVVSYQTGWFFPCDGTPPVKKRTSFIAEAKTSASTDLKSLAASLSGVAGRVMPAVVNISSMRVYRTPGQLPPSPFLPRSLLQGLLWRRFLPVLRDPTRTGGEKPHYPPGGIPTRLWWGISCWPLATLLV